MAHAQKPDFVFRRNGRVHLNRRGTSVQSTTGSRGVCISGSNAGYTMFRSNVKSIGYPLHSPVYPSLPLPSVTVCHHISTELYRHLSQYSVVSDGMVKYLLVRWHKRVYIYIYIYTECSFFYLTDERRPDPFSNFLLLISNFRPVLNVVSFLLGNPRAFEFCMLTFWKTLYVPSS